MADLRRKWSTIPKAAAFHNQPPHFAVWRLFVSLRSRLPEIALVLVHFITLPDSS
jgi:hypothetical protein